MADDQEVRKVKIHYRLAKFISDECVDGNLQNLLTSALKSTLGDDARERILPMSEDDNHQGCLNYSVSDQKMFVADVMHLDGRKTLPRWIHPKKPEPFAQVRPVEIMDGEASLGEPLYILVVGNHVAVIERLGFRSTNLAKYITALLKKSSSIPENSEIKLVPKIEVSGKKWAGGGVKKVVVKPKAGVLGEAPSRVHGEARRASNAARVFEDMVGRGQQVWDALSAFGADEAKLEKLREAMSADLMLKARLELSVAAVRKKSTAEISVDDVQQALADLTNEGEVTIVSQDGKTDGRLTQLVDSADVLEVGGLLDWKHATHALNSAMNSWAAKGVIDLD